jgi:AbrB family looped-hinge helix DNA binding protein
VRTTVSTKGQIVLPAELRRRDGIEPGQTFEVERTDAGNYVLRRVEEGANAGLVDLLLRCPVKGWFVPLERNETTDELGRPDFE